MAPNNGMRKVKQYKISSKNKRINALLKTKNPKLFLCSRNEGNHKKKQSDFVIIYLFIKSKSRYHKRAKSAAQEKINKLKEQLAATTLWNCY